MIKGVRQAAEAKQLGAGPRVLVRLGALLKKKIALTPAVLEACTSGSPLEAFLLTPELLKQAETLTADTFLQLVKHPPQPFAEPIKIHVGSDGFRVICFNEEEDAEGGWDEPDTPSETTPNPPTQTVQQTSLLKTDSSASNGIANSSALAPGLRLGEGVGEALFSPIELGRLRIKAITAAHEPDRIEAIRILAHAPVPDQEKAEILFQALKDDGAPVRSEAASLLFVLGVPEEFCQTLKNLNNLDLPVRVRASERLQKRFQAGGSDLEISAGAVCALAEIQYEEDGPNVTNLLKVLALCASGVLRSQDQTALLIRIVVAKVAAAEQGVPKRATMGVFPAGKRLLRSLFKESPEFILSALNKELKKASDTHSESFILQLLLEFQDSGTTEEATLLATCAKFLSLDQTETRDSRAVGMIMVKKAEGTITAVSQIFEEATISAQRYFLRLFEEIICFQKVSPEATEQAGNCLHQALLSASRSLRTSALSCRYGSNPGISEELRTELTKAILNSIHELGFETDIEIAEGHLARIGLPAIPTLLERLSSERPANARVQAVRILGELAFNLRPLRGQMSIFATAVTNVLRDLQALTTDLTFPGRGELFATLGKLASSPAASKKAGQVISRKLFSAIESEDPKEGQGALEGLSYLAASRRADPQLIATTTGIIRRTLLEANIEINAETKIINGETIIELNSGDDLIDRLPIALRGIARIASSNSCPPAFRKEIIVELIGRWQLILKNALTWGPANAMLLVETLRDIACFPELAHPQRMLILKALAPRLKHIPVMVAMTTILEKCDTKETCVVALTIGQAILKRRGPDGVFENEDRQDILSALGKIAARSFLGAPNEDGKNSTSTFRQTTINELFKGAKDNIPGCSKSLDLLMINNVLSTSAQNELEQQLNEFMRHG